MMDDRPQTMNAYESAPPPQGEVRTTRGGKNNSDIFGTFENFN